MIDEYIKYAKGMNASEEVMFWINTTLKKSIKTVSHTNAEHIIDYLVSNNAPKRLRKMSIAQAKDSAKRWSEVQQKKGKNLVDSKDDIEIIHDFLNGSKIVKLLTKKAYKREGYLMRHCLGGYDPKSEVSIYSYRDKKNLPHATFEVREGNNEIVQIKGKGNGPIHPKYIYPILEFLKSIGQEVRSSEMENLGYYHVHKDLVEFVKNLKGVEDQITVIYGELYVH
jgi:hypothetical protein